MPIAPAALSLRLALLATLLLASLIPPAITLAGGPLPYDIVYVRQPRYGDTTNTVWPDVGQPGRMEPGADLMLLHADGAQEILVDPGPDGAITDPAVSLDAQWVYYSHFYNVSPAGLNPERNFLSYAGSDLFRIHLQTREIQQLTFGEFTPADAAGQWDHTNPLTTNPTKNSLGYGVMNTGPCPLPGGRLAFTSSRLALELPRGSRYPVFQIYVMDEDGANVTPVSPMSLSGALHPTLMQDGRILFSSHESQGTRDRRQWSLMAMYPDGRNWIPVVSAFRRAQAFHFPTQIAGGDLVFVDYYNFNNKGFGALRRLPTPSFTGMGPFNSALKDDNPRLWFTDSDGAFSNFRMPFTPVGMYSLTPFTHARDNAAPLLPDGVTRAGKVTQPAAAPNGDILVTWSGGPVNDLDRPTNLPAVDSGLYLIPAGQTMDAVDELILIRNSPNFNEAWPRPVVPWTDIHGAPPAQLPWLPNDGSHAELPAGSPHGLIGSPSLTYRETAPGFIEGVEQWSGLDPFASLTGMSSNWAWQGADAGLYEDEDIYAVRIVMLEPNTHRSYGPDAGRQYSNHAGERMRILGEIPVLKPDGSGGYLTSSGSTDTSFIAKIPADTPFTFQTLDRRGMVLNMAQTWHQVRPGEIRNNCGGCHAHSLTPIDFNTTIASTPSYDIPDLAHGTPILKASGSADPIVQQRPERAVDVEFYRDIRPILQRSCIQCHTRVNPLPPGALVLDDYTLYNGIPGDYARLASDPGGDWGYPSVMANGDWSGANVSRYIRMFQSRRSLLMWKLHGERLDGWSNSDHPTELVPGVALTLPIGASPADADLDYTGQRMPPPGSGVPALTEDELMTFARWIDLGCPIDTGRETGRQHLGWFLDELRPIVHIDLPRAGAAPGPVTQFRLGLADAFSGLDIESLSVTASVPVDGRPAGAELADLFLPIGDDIWVANLGDPVQATGPVDLTVEVSDQQGNRNTTTRRFTVSPVTPTCPGDADGDLTVTINDLNRVLENWFQTVTPNTEGDVTGDGDIDFDDLNRVLSHWGATCN